MIKVVIVTFADAGVGIIVWNKTNVRIFIIIFIINIFLEFGVFVKVYKS